jgi:hypothetical protein
MSFFGPLASHREGVEALCPICLEEFQARESVFVNSPTCTHELHESCAREWAAAKGRRVTCPLCRQPYSEEDKNLLVPALPPDEDDTHDVWPIDRWPVNLELRMEASARFEQLRDLLLAWLEHATDDDVCKAIVRTVLFDADQRSWHNEYLFASLVTGRAEDWQYFVRLERWLDVHGHWWHDLSPRLTAAFVTILLMKAKVAGLQPESLNGWGDMVAREHEDTRRVFGIVSNWTPYRADPFRHPWINYWLRRPVGPDQLEIARRCFAFVQQSSTGWEMLFS